MCEVVEPGDAKPDVVKHGVTVSEIVELGDAELEVMEHGVVVSEVVELGVAVSEVVGLGDAGLTPSSSIQPQQLRLRDEAELGKDTVARLV